MNIFIILYFIGFALNFYALYTGSENNKLPSNYLYIIIVMILYPVFWIMFILSKPNDNK
jgi:lipopolysaccharide export LptBFGC system permease protein LptF